MVDDDFEDWIDEANGFAIELLNFGHDHLNLQDAPRYCPFPRPTSSLTASVLAQEVSSSPIPRLEKARMRDNGILQIEKFLQDLKRPDGLTDLEFKQFARQTFGYFVMGGRLWRKRPTGAHQLYVPEPR